MTEDSLEWIPAAQALQTVAKRFAASIGYNGPEALREAAKAILERAAAGTLRTAAKGILPEYDGEKAPLRYWFHLREVEPNGRKTDHDLSLERDDACCIPTDFWRVFKHSAAASQADWASGDFYITEFAEPAAVWSGVARDVQFERFALPGASGHADQVRSWAQRSDLPTNKGGAPLQYDWLGAFAHLVAVANEEGLDPISRGKELNFSHIARLMEEWFDTQGVKRPGNQGRRYARMIVGAIRQLREAKESETE